VHHQRATHDAILVGHTTLLSDRPSLTTRLWDGPSPLRIVLGNPSEGELPAGFEACSDIDTLLVSLNRRGVQSLLVEGGCQTLQSFIDRGLWDEAWRELSPVVLGSGVPGPRMPVGVSRKTLHRFGRTVEYWSNNIE
jgi:diaminohydroxyphosphoribosylaminopyrimidine deaminase/5-amino-6-(5-phosphoribosylamino)uracil reductase